MKIKFNNERLGIMIMVAFFLLPFMSAIPAKHKILYNLSKQANYVPAQIQKPNATFEEVRAHDALRASFLANMGISTGELWMSRIRFVFLLVGGVIAGIVIIGYTNALMTNEIKFETVINLKNPLKPETEEDKLERLGRQLLSLPHDEQEFLMNRMNDSLSLTSGYETTEAVEEEDSYTPHKWSS